MSEEKTITQVFVICMKKIKNNEQNTIKIRPIDNFLTLKIYIKLIWDVSNSTTESIYYLHFFLY